MQTPASMNIGVEAVSPDSKIARTPAQALMAKAPFVAVATIAALSLVAILLIALAEADGVPSHELHYQAAAVMLGVMLLACIAGIVIQQALHRSAAAAAIREAEARVQLTRDKDAAEAASAAKSRYLASVSHEIRSPLNSIYGYAQLLERGGEIGPVEAARVIRRSAEHLTNLVEGLLDISQVENGVLRVSHDVVRFAPFLDQIASMFRHAAASKGLRLIYDRPEMLPEFVRMDQKRVRQILINLLSNAIKFTADGTVTFKVGYSGQTALFDISDTGPGIPPQDHERIFIPFERGTGEQAHQPGIGLGLAITQALVQILGGELSLDSEMGQGSRFRVRMMLGQVAGKMGELAPAALVTGYEGPRKSVLVIDDDGNQLTLMRSLLESFGFDVAVANSGETGLALCSGRSFDLALLDISMPGISGWETARRLRENCGHAIRIIMLSGNAHEKHGDGGPIVHDQFIVKPVELSALIDAIGAQLELRWTSAADTMLDTGGAAPKSAAIPDAARPHLEKIRELLRIGHVRGIEDEIKQLADAAPEADDLTARLYDCLDRFDLSGLGDVLEKHI